MNIVTTAQKKLYDRDISNLLNHQDPQASFKNVFDELKKRTKNIDTTDKNLRYILEIKPRLLEFCDTNLKDQEIYLYFVQLIAKNNFLDPTGIEFFKILNNLKKQNNEHFYFDRECNAFQVMRDRPFCATFKNFDTIYNIWKSKYFVNQHTTENIYDKMDLFSKYSYQIPFSRMNIKKCLDAYKNNQFLFPFLCHLYVDYFENINAPLLIIKNEKTRKDFINDYYRTYGISYIWKILNIAEDMDPKILPFDEPTQQLEMKILFPEEKLKKEIQYQDIRPIYLLTDHLSSEKIITMIRFILQDGKQSILNFLKENDANLKSTCIMVAQITFKILNYLKEKDKELLKSCFRIFCIIASTPNFRFGQNFATISYLIQVLINFYIENEDLLDLLGNAQSLFTQFILYGPSFFSLGNSRKNNETFLLQRMNEFEKDRYLYSGYPSISEKLRKQARGDDKISISFAIEKNVDLYDVKYWIENRDNIDDNYLYDVLPFFIFNEAKHNVPPEKNEGSFHSKLRELIKNDTYQIGTKIWNQYFNSQSDNYYKIFTGKSPLTLHLKNCFYWYIIRFLILIDESTITLHVEESNYNCKRLFIKFFILSHPKDERDLKFTTLLRYKNCKQLLKGIERKAKHYCEQMNLMYSSILLIDANNLMDKLDIIIKFLSKYLNELGPNMLSNCTEKEIIKTKKMADEVLDLAVKQIKYKSDVSGKRSALLNQMCKKIFKTFEVSLKSDENESNKSDDFVIQLFTSFSYESINLIATKAAMKKITKIIKKLNSRQSKIVTVSLFNFFEGRRSENELIMEILKKEKLFFEKKKVIDNNSGHLYLKKRNFCNDCLKRFVKSKDQCIYQFFSCNHLFHIRDCIGNRRYDYYKICPICPSDQKQIDKRKTREKVPKMNSFYDNYFNMKNDNFQKSIENSSLKVNLQNSMVSFHAVNVNKEIKYFDVASMFDNDDEISIAFNDE